MWAGRTGGIKNGRRGGVFPWGRGVFGESERASGGAGGPEINLPRSDRSCRQEWARAQRDRSREIGRGRRGRIPGRPLLLPHRRAPWRARSEAGPLVPEENQLGKEGRRLREGGGLADVVKNRCDGLRVGEERNEGEGFLAGRTDERKDFIDPGQESSPPGGTGGGGSRFLRC